MTQDVRTKIIFTFAKQFTLQNRRAMIVNGAFSEFPYLLMQIQYEGAPAEFASRLHDQLFNYGSLPDGRVALVVLLEEIKSTLGIDKQQEIDRLIKQLAEKKEPVAVSESDSLLDSVTGQFFNREDFERAAQFYVEPYCQHTDPSFGDEAIAERKLLFSEMDRWLQEASSSNKHILLLGDSGMGKSAFLMNYYWRNLQKTPVVGYRMVLIPLLAGTDDRFDLEAIIVGIDNKSETTLLLDALDEDRNAWEGAANSGEYSKGILAQLKEPQHRKRVYQICQWTDTFRSVVITCRTQFFPREEEIPDKTGRLRFGAVGGIDGTKIYKFRRSYLSLFSETQISQYLHTRFPEDTSILKKAKLLIERIPDLTCRPLILSYLQDLVEEEKEYQYSFQLFEVIVQSWLKREIFDDHELYNFSKRLAIELFENEGSNDLRKSTGFLYAEIADIARKYDIPLATWQLTGRSLLHRDALDRFKFAHRSIMEHLYVIRWLEMTSHERPAAKWTDQMRRFLKDTLRDRFSAFRTLETVLNEAGIPGHELSVREVRENNIRYILIGQGKWNFDLDLSFFEAVYYKPTETKDNVVLDLWSGLMWQRSGSVRGFTYRRSKEYIAELNRNSFAGFTDWRLPASEELLSLQEPKRSGLFIHPVFDSQQKWCWTVDRASSGRAWLVYFSLGHCYHGVGDLYVRAVRSVLPRQ